nr:MAG TPA: hypothetical protein [Caudoviricetes sp.]
MLQYRYHSFLKLPFCVFSNHLCDYCNYIIAHICACVNAQKSQK